MMHMFWYNLNFIYTTSRNNTFRLQILVNANNECKESLSTAEKVTSCPKTAKEWNKAAERKGCKHITNACSSFEYHCVINVWRNETFEVCAPQWNIVGYKDKQHLNFLS